MSWIPIVLVSMGVVMLIECWRQSKKDGHKPGPWFGA